MNLQANWLNSSAANKIFETIETKGHELYFVGGCVRNALMGHPVTDLDLATDAKPTEVMDLCSKAGIKVVPTGIDHGTVTAILDGVPFEITTYRADIKTDGRHAEVAFSSSIEEDAARRDFTMNALYADRSGTIRDPIGGLADLRSAVVRFIGDSRDRIQEDYLRILRFFRFFAWYGDPENGIEPEGLAACAEFADQIPNLSKERITSELLKLLGAPDPSLSMGSMAASGVLAHCLPGADAASLPVLVHNEALVDQSVEPILRLAVIGGDPNRDLRLSKKQFRMIEALSLSYPTPAETGYRLQDLAIPSMLLQAAAVRLEIDPDKVQIARSSMASQFPISAKDLPQALRGPEIGARLQELEQRWIDSGFSLSKAELLA